MQLSPPNPFAAHPPICEEGPLLFLLIVVAATTRKQSSDLGYLALPLPLELPLELQAT